MAKKKAKADVSGKAKGPPSPHPIHTSTFFGLLCFPFIFGSLTAYFVSPQIYETLSQSFISTASSIFSSMDTPTSSSSHQGKRRILNENSALDDIARASESSLNVAEWRQHTVPQKSMVGLRAGEVTFNIYTNGSPEPTKSTVTLATPLTTVDRFVFDSYLTSHFARDISSDEINIVDFCDMGPKKTPILYNHNDLVAYGDDEKLPCSLYTRLGVPMFDHLGSSSLNDALVEEKFHQRQHIGVGSPIDVYLVPAGRNFMFAPKFVGERFDLQHVTRPVGGGIDEGGIYLTTLSLSPKVFELHNFFSEAESETLVKQALEQKSETHKLQRSSTGADGRSENPTRTSENAFDTHSPVAVRIKKRCFETLGFPSYQEDMGDGLQVLRYNTSKAYIAHLDWIDDSPINEHDFLSQGVGSNRFATILLYFTDMEEGQGGETVFVKGYQPGESAASVMTVPDAIKDARKAGAVDIFKEGSWEEKLVAQCRTRLSYRPRKAGAVLFYSQEPDGTPDKQSLHGGCPVLHSPAKWAANLWVWNAPRMGYPKAPMKAKFKKKNGSKAVDSPQQAKQQAVTFKNSGKHADVIRLMWKNTNLGTHDSWGEIEVGSSKNMNTFAGHTWVAMKASSDDVLATAEIEKSTTEIVF